MKFRVFSYFFVLFAGVTFSAHDAHSTQRMIDIDLTGYNFHDVRLWGNTIPQTKVRFSVSEDDFFRLPHISFGGTFLFAKCEFESLSAKNHNGEVIYTLLAATEHTFGLEDATCEISIYNPTVKKVARISILFSEDG